MDAADETILEAQGVAMDVDQPQPRQQPRHRDRVEMLPPGQDARCPWIVRQ
jgi:hypothetical protein